MGREITEFNQNTRHYSFINNIPPLNIWTKEISFSSLSQAFFDALTHFEKL